MSMNLVLHGFNLSWMMFFGLVVFLVIYVVITFVIKVYSKWYMGGSVWVNYFFFVYLGFFLVMWFLVLSLESVNFIVFWELLGVSSFFLVLFFVNWESMGGAVNTMLANHLGGLFLMLVMWVSQSTSISNLLPFLLLYLMIVSFSKSAQLPFSAWLPMAMSAPTPVSSLVHSSTLVTAGLFIVWLFGSEGLGWVGWGVSLMTLFLSGLLALIEKDLKKLVALSTLSQISFCMMLLLSGLFMGSYFQMLSHAIFKSCLFLQAGVVIYFTLGSQEFRVINSLQMVFLVIMVSCVISLSGLLFLSGMFSKEQSLSMIFNKSSGLLGVVIMTISVSLTLFYSWLLLKSLSLLAMTSSEVSFHSLSSLILFLGVLCFGLFFSVWYMNLQLVYVEGLIAFFMLLWSFNWMMSSLKLVLSFFYLLVLSEFFKLLGGLFNKSLSWVEVLNNSLILFIFWSLSVFSIKVKVYLSVSFFVSSLFMFLLL